MEHAIKVGTPSQDDMEDIKTILIPEKDIINLINQGRISHGLVLNGLMFYHLHKQ